MYTSHATPQKQFHKKGMQLMTFDLFTLAKTTSLLPVFGILKFHSTAIYSSSSLLQCVACRPVVPKLRYAYP